MQRTSNTIVFLLTAGCFLAFFVFGLTDNLKGPTLPAMLAEMHINYGMGGNIFFGEYLGFLIATLITGILADKYGLKVVILLAGVCLGLGVSGYSSSHSAWLLAASLFVIGLGFGALELGPNAIIVNLHHQRKGIFLNLMAVLHGLGSMIAPLIAGWMLSQSISWRIIYRWDLIVIALFILFFIFLRFPHSKRVESVQLNFREIPRVAFKGQMPWFYTSIAFYVAAEIGVASWLVTFLQDVRHISVATSSQALSLFFGMMMLGRLLGSFIVQRIGYLRSILFAAFGALLCISLGLFGPQYFSIFLPLTGLFFSIIFPTLTAAASEGQVKNVNTILGVLFTFAGLGALIGPWLVGWASDLFSLQIGFGVNILFSALTLVSTFILLKGHQYDSKT